MSINNVTLVGRLTKDPDLRYAQSGTPIARFTLAVNRTRKVEGQPDADFISCIAFSKTAENLANFQKKGSQIGVVGRIQTGSFEGQDGKRVYTTDIVADSIQFLEPRCDGGQGQIQPNNGGYQQQNAPQTQYQQPQQQYQAPPQQQQEPYQQPSQQYQQPPQQSQPQYGQQQQQNYTRVDEDPFAKNNGPIDISSDDLPF